MINKNHTPIKLQFFPQCLHFFLDKLCAQFCIDHSHKNRTFIEVEYNPLGEGAKNSAAEPNLHVV